MAKATVFGLLRHGQTEWNREKIIQGQSHSDLTDYGRSRAEAWGGSLGRYGCELILSSDLKRAVDTAELVNASLKLPMLRDPRLREEDWGEWVGLSRRDLQHAPVYGLPDEEAKGWEFRPPGGESRREVLRRARAALLDAAAAHPGATILVVTHEGVIKSLVYYLEARRFTPDEPAILKDERVHFLISDGDRLAIRELNAEL
jgi:probable phosphoglycerate mutase